MRYVSDKNEYQLLLQQQPALKASYSGEHFVDAWFSEQSTAHREVVMGQVQLLETENGIFGVIELPYDNNIVAITQEAYQQIFAAMQGYTGYTIIRFWNYVPEITSFTDASGVTIYQLFNEGRQAAFKSWYGSALSDIPVPAASAVGSTKPCLRIEFLAATTLIQQIENRNQIAAYHYSEQYGRIAPFFSRGAIYNNNGQRLLLSSGTASIKGENSLHAGDIYEQLYQSMHNLRILGSQFNLKQYGIHYGFALEDIAALRVYYKEEKDKAFLERFVPKFLSPSCHISFMHAAICREELLVELEAVFIKKGETEQGQQPKYFLQGRKIKTESFEIHVAEHCNLKCRDCCNISPFNAKKFIEISEVTEICAFVNKHLIPDVFKVAGGEPTLHPKLDEILQTIKQLCPGVIVRVVSNGLLLHRMSEIFWKHIDQLTISNYISAPVKPQLLEQIRQKARINEVVLNVKYVEQFNEIFVEDKMEDSHRIQQIYDDCWMRHRCLIVRNGYFYKCTRAAYMNEYLTMKGLPVSAGDSSYSVEDGIPVDDPLFQEKAIEYLNSVQPLQSCSYCLGVSGNLRENIQMKQVLQKQGTVTS